ncbi:MAG: hypothetical protein KKF27_21580 [Gammaproteobacteria bacterium]|nr:hypothetical protein [Gammaproteobacteria bacterium]MBU2685841.1 hypothetical protein [Gammaproteobacteria bacterium]
MTDEQQNADELKSQLESLQKEKEEMTSELEKYKEKEMNFEKLRKREEETKKEISEKDKQIQTKEEEWSQKVEELKLDQQKWKEDQLTDTRERLFKQKCGEDKDLREKVEHEMRNLIGDVNTPDQLEQKMNRAYLLATGEMPVRPSAISQVTGTTGAYDRKARSDKYTDSEEGKDVVKTFFKKRGLDAEKAEELASKPRGSYFDNL